MRSLHSARSLTVALALCASAASQDATRQREFFERSVRPLLAESCHRCHGPDKQKSDLRLDHGSFARAGGSRGPAVVPGDADASLIVQAVRYRDPDLSMPPKNRLDADQVAILERWIDDGAWWPDEPVPETDAGPAESFDLEARRAEHWAWQPIDRSVTPPPTTAASPVDRFLTARLEAAGLEPAPTARPEVWLRRIHFDLIGLPPTPAEIRTFVADPSRQARAAVVDRLLASPHFGERQARHWMDLVRYAETLGHEYDFHIPDAWRYRDYLIRAFDADVPYDRVIAEHIAGDLLEPRIDPATGTNQSKIATASWWFGDQTHSPVDTRQHQADRIDNQIDVITKSFLGLTVSCARCHDHKFDAISQADYYALFGIVQSSRYALAAVDGPAADAAAERARELEAKRRAVGRERVEAWRALGHRGDLDVAELMLAAEDVRARPADDRERAIVDIAAGRGLDGPRLRRWVDSIEQRPRGDDRFGDPLAAWRGARTTPDERSRDGDVVLADFAEVPFDRDPRWTARGPGFGTTTAPAGLGVRRGGDPAAPRPAVHADGWADSASGGGSKRLWGALQSDSFTLEHRYIHCLVAGHESRINVVFDGFHVIRDPIYGRLKRHLEGGQRHWVTFDVAMWRGQRTFLEFHDIPVHDPADPHRPRGYADDGWIAVREVVLSDQPEPPVHATAVAAEPDTPRQRLAERYEQAAISALDALAAGAVADADDGDTAPTTLTPGQAAWLDHLTRHGLLPPLPQLATAERELAAAEREIPAPRFSPTIGEGDALDAPLLIRGGHSNPGEIVPRRFLTALGGQPVPDGRHNSGRRALAAWIANANNPLTARVAVNRVWHHLFGRGIVPTVDNFGVLGEPPSHPELLDWLAARFVDDGWSIKQLIRDLVLTEAYARDSAPIPAGDRLDPENRLLHRMPIRRLEGEAIRDAILTVSGRLDRKLFGPPVPVHLTPFMEGRGRPGRSGPADGDGRRSVYLEVRRNFLNPFFLAFDTPIPFQTVGRRASSNVPAQALSMLNDPFVHAQAALWAEHVLAKEGRTDAERVEGMYLAALGRWPNEVEHERTLAFVTESEDREAAWRDLAHVLFNHKAFAFLH